MVDTVDMGRFADGQRMILPVPGRHGAHWLVGGSTGAGKTSALKVLCAELVTRYGDRIAVVVSDPHLVGFRKWEPRVSCLAYGMEQAVPLLTLVEETMRRRYRLMYDLRLDEWTPDLADVVGPYIVAIFDELAGVTISLGKEATPRLIKLAQEARKVGIGLVLATQSPKAKVVDMLVREQCAIRICFRTREPEQTDCILGSQRYPVHQPEHPEGIPFEMRGGCYVDDGLRVRRGRTKGLDPAVEAHVAVGHQADTPDLGWPRVLHPNLEVSA